MKLWVIKLRWRLDKGFLGHLETRLHYIKPISSALLFTVTSLGKREPTGNKVHNIHVIIFLGVYFYCSKQLKQVFFLMNYNKFVSTAHANEWIVWVVTKESLKSYPACVLIPFPADSKGGIFDFILNTTKSRHRTTILSYVSLQSFIYSLLFIPLQC